eukprot:TRINITY_DN3306_c0_g1_i10.p1 TRINITY_DN3306_c0_g1~~TRINITY_DN3306_c0_g1_i10.p1  ORF type:complete len:265 (-),score=89.88 TRINITY_DN3306_c0_g1_i10:1008-1802(-)
MCIRDSINAEYGGQGWAMAAGMGSGEKLAFLKQAYKKLERDSTARESELLSIQSEMTEQHERERNSFQLQKGELEEELRNSENLWRTIKEENASLKEQMEKSPAPVEKPGEVSVGDRMGNFFKNIGRVDWEKECAALRERLEQAQGELSDRNQAYEQLEATLTAQEAEVVQARLALEGLSQMDTKQSSALQVQLSVLEGTHDELKEQLDAKVAELERCREHLESSKKREERLKEDYGEEKQKNAGLRSERQELFQKKSEAEVGF